MIPKELSINIYGKNYSIFISEYEDLLRDRKQYMFKITELNLVYYFSLDLFSLSNFDDNVFYYHLEYHLNCFKKEIEHNVFNPNKYNYCTKELILEKYFESYIYRIKNNYNYYNEKYILNNPNLILGRQKGHTQALVDFVKDPQNRDIVEDSFIAFPNYSCKSEFFSRLDLETIQRIRFNTVTSSTYTIGIRKSFIIFNSYEIIKNDIINYLQHPFIKHFIILGS